MIKQEEDGMTDQASNTAATRTIRTGQDMRAARQAMGLTQEDAALLLGMMRPALSDIEREAGNRMPTHQQVAHIRSLQRMHRAGILAGYLADLKKK